MKIAELILGYRLNDRSALFTVHPKTLLHHTLIVGQSGSGKSFLVARLLEEIILHTRARIVVLDPNGDFRDFGQASLRAWNDTATKSELAHAYELAVGRGLVTFDAEDSFKISWGHVLLTHLSTDKDERRPSTSKTYFGPLRLDWQTLEDEQDFLLAIDPASQAKTLLGLKACRENLVWVTTERPSLAPPPNLRGLIDIADRFANQDINLERYQYVKSLTREHWEAVQAHLLDLLRRHAALWYGPQPTARDELPPDLCDFIDLAFGHRQAASNESWEVLLLGLDSAAPADSRLVAEVTLWRLWKRVKEARSAALRVSDGKPSESTAGDHQATTRVPIFVVVDEAHNFAPADTSDTLTRRVTERMIQIASEGRKYGLYLILATQRPTKLHPGLVAECENQCVLRLQASIEHKFAADVLGIPIERARNVDRFATGQALIAGRWLGGSGVEDITITPARTAVGGGGLGVEWFASGIAAAAARTLLLPAQLLSVSTSEDAVRGTLRSHAIALLEASKGKIALVRLAQEIDRRVGNTGSSSKWGNSGGFTEFVRLLGRDTAVRMKIEGTKGWAYLEGQHDPDGPEDEGSWLAGIIRIPPAAERVSAETEIPRLVSEAYANIFKWIAEATDGAPFSLASVTRLVRDKAVTAGYRFSRRDANFIMHGLLLQGHVFAPDVRQTDVGLAEVYFRNVIELGRRAGLTLSTEEEEEIRKWICGGLPPSSPAATATASPVQETGTPRPT